MKVALLGDVHANLPALEAVLADARARGAEAIWHLGDFVGYGAFPEAVVCCLRAAQALSVIGNYDRKALKAKKGKPPTTKSPQKWLAFRWAHDNLSKESRKYLRSLPEQIRLEAEGKRVLLVHASPASTKEHLTPQTTDERLRELALVAAADIVVCGHSHQPFKRKVDGVWFINPGSVGRPDDGDPRASYAILQLGPRLFQVRHYRVTYEFARAAAALREQKLPEAFAQMVLQGRSLDAVLQPTPQEENP